MVAPAGLIVDDCDEAGCARAEGILCGSIGDTTSRHRSNVEGCTIRGALHLVEGTTVGIIQGTSGAVSGDTGSAAGGVDVAGASSY